MSTSTDTAETDIQVGDAKPRAKVSMKRLCCLFCCPPCPSSIASKLAFNPPKPSYRMIGKETASQYTLQFIEGRAEWPHESDELNQVMDVFYTRTRRRNNIVCMYVKAVGNAANYTLLFSHGNASDLAIMCSFYFGLGYRLGCNVFSYDYSGYGCSSGKPSEKNLYADIAAAFLAMKTHYDIPPEKVILYGQSIGTVPAVDLASKEAKIGGVILHSPLMSGMRVICPETKRTWCCDAFPSIDKVENVRSPTLVIHGTDDKVIDFSHGMSIYERCPSSVEPLWISGAGHDDVELHAAYLERLRSFIEQEVGHNNRQRKANNGVVPPIKNNASR